jgi:BclB C-terminal domain-containing protein
MTSIAGGLSGLPSFIGFGSSAQGTANLGPVIDLTGGPGININEAFSVPRDGTITSISASFSTTSALSLVGTTVTVTAQLYEAASQGSTEFIPVPGALVNLMYPLTGIVAQGTTSSWTNPVLNIPVSA